jgi:hypothetical protein
MCAVEFLRHTKASFAAAFGDTALRRAGRVRMARNAAVVLGNLGDAGAAEPLTDALRDPEPLVRGHAAWALGRLGAVEPLRRALAAEEDPAVREEIDAARGRSGPRSFGRRRNSVRGGRDSVGRKPRRRRGIMGM